jgi:2-polyprenyl-6-methoxyphenol hydroxylase-like FAD-dependent oxidoreductase
MVVSRHGYVGLARCGTDQLNVAAALDPDSLYRATAGELVAGLLRDTGVSDPTLADLRLATWHGTPPLTSRPSRVTAERLFVVGDASGYVEPFSGEGMAAALECAAAVAPLAAQAARDWSSSLADRWETVQRRLVVDQLATCRQLAWILRRPWAAAAAVGICRAQPWVARRFIAKVS